MDDNLIQFPQNEQEREMVKSLKTKKSNPTQNSVDQPAPPRFIIQIPGFLDLSKGLDNTNRRLGDLSSDLYELNKRLDHFVKTIYSLVRGAFIGVCIYWLYKWVG